MAENQTQAPPPVQPPPPNTTSSGGSEKDARLWNMLCHLAGVIPCIPCLLTVLIWQIKKAEFPSVDVHGKRALNFQISVFIVMVVFQVAVIILSHILSFLGILGFVGPLIWLGYVILCIIAGIKANNGEDYKYPWSLELIK
jgi:uncharacterized Tic20 family protein